LTSELKTGGGIVLKKLKVAIMWANAMHRLISGIFLKTSAPTSTASYSVSNSKLSIWNSSWSLAFPA
jgi:hypothetical protein